MPLGVGFVYSLRKKLIDFCAHLFGNQTKKKVTPLASRGIAFKGQGKAATPLKFLNFFIRVD